MSVGDVWNVAAQIEGIEWIIILIIVAVLLLFGPQKIPDLFRGFGRALGEFRRGRMEVEREISAELTQLDTRDARVRVEKAAGALGVPATGPSALHDPRSTGWCTATTSRPFRRSPCSNGSCTPISSPSPRPRRRSRPSSS